MVHCNKFLTFFWKLRTFGKYEGNTSLLDRFLVSVPPAIRPTSADVEQAQQAMATFRIKSLEPIYATIRDLLNPEDPKVFTLGMKYKKIGIRPQQDLQFVNFKWNSFPVPHNPPGKNPLNHWGVSPLFYQKVK